MPKKLERKLKAQARKKGYKGKRADRYVYGTMNKMGVMRGNKAVKRHSPDAEKMPDASVLDFVEELGCENHMEQEM